MKKLQTLWAFFTANIGVYFALFAAIWFIAWTSNALYKTGFDLAKLESMGQFILGKYATDSALNTKFGAKENKTE